MKGDFIISIDGPTRYQKMLCWLLRRAYRKRDGVTTLRIKLICMLLGHSLVNKPFTCTEITE